MKKLALLALLIAASAFALPGDGMPDGKWWKNPRIAERIQLSETQVNSLEKIFRRTRPVLIDLRADLEKKRLELQSTMDEKNVDSAEASRRIDDVERARTALAKARAMMFVEFRGVLTPEQWDRLRALARDFRERRQERLFERDEPAPRQRR